MELTLFEKEFVDLVYEGRSVMGDNRAKNRAGKAMNKIVGKILDEFGLEGLSGLLNHEDGVVQFYSSATLAKIKPKNDVTLPKMKELAKSENKEAQLYANTYLIAIGEDSSYLRGPFKSL